MDYPYSRNWVVEQEKDLNVKQIYRSQSLKISGLPYPFDEANGIYVSESKYPYGQSHYNSLNKEIKWDPGYQYFRKSDTSNSSFKLDGNYLYWGLYKKIENIYQNEIYVNIATIPITSNIICSELLETKWKIYCNETKSWVENINIKIDPVF